jgi:hypothetical protein
MACNVMYKDRACVDLGSFEKRGRYDQVDTQCVGSHIIFDNGGYRSSASANPIRLQEAQTSMRITLLLIQVLAL